MSKRKLQADIVMVCALANAHTYQDLSQGYIKTREVMRVFDCHRSTATRIMDYCATYNEHCWADAVYIGGGRYSKAIVVDATRLMRADYNIFRRVWIDAHRNRIALGLSYSTLDALKTMAEVVYEYAK